MNAQIVEVNDVDYRQQRAIEWNQKRRSRAIQTQKAAERALRGQKFANKIRGLVSIERSEKSSSKVEV
jgi:hypothetical protein